MLTMMVLALAVAIPAFAATNKTYTFYYNGAPSTHASAFINGPAVVDNDGFTTTFTLLNTSNVIKGVKYNGATVPVTYSSGNAVFTIEVFNFNAPVSITLDLQYPGGHSAPMTVQAVF